MRSRMTHDEIKPQAILSGIGRQHVVNRSRGRGHRAGARCNCKIGVVTTTAGDSSSVIASGSDSSGRPDRRSAGGPRVHRGADGGTARRSLGRGRLRTAERTADIERR